MKRLTLVLAIMVTGLSFAQDLSSFTVTDTVKRYKVVKDGVWTLHMDEGFSGSELSGKFKKGFISTEKIILIEYKGGSSFDNYNRIVTSLIEILEDNEDMVHLFEETFEEMISRVHNRYDKNKYEITIQGGGSGDCFRIENRNIIRLVTISVKESFYSITISEWIKPSKIGSAPF